jgi:hypothetical protein
LRPARGCCLLALAAALAAAAPACGGADPASGVGALMRVSNAQFVEGALPSSQSETEPAVRGVSLLNTNVYPGQEGFPVSGAVEDGATILIGLAGDAGYWIVAAPLADSTTPDNYDFSTQISFSPLLPAGMQTLVLRGVAPDGQIGPAQELTLTVAPNVPTGALVITLEWDTQSDLDLHVVIPNTVDPTKPIEIWARAPVGLPPPQLGVPPATPDEIAAAGYLDFDSNAACVIDGRRQENVIFAASPPSGNYVVRVDASSLCGQADAQWQVIATTADGTRLGFARWEATDADTRGSHGLGAGRLAFNFSIP